MSEDWTRDRCAEHWGISPSTWSGYVARGYAPRPHTHVGRTPLWDAGVVRDYARPRQGARTDLVIPDELPVIYETTVGTRDSSIGGKVEPLPRRWHVAVFDRAAKDDTLLRVMTPSGQAVVTVTWADRLNEGDDELSEAVALTVRAARLIWQATPRLLAGAKPAEIWPDVAEAWKFAGQSAYFAWAEEVARSGAATEANL